MNPKEILARSAVKTSLRIAFKLPSGLPIPASFARKGMEMGSVLFQTRPEVSVEHIAIGGINAERVAVDSRAPCAMLHFHGGAFFAGSAKTHRAMASEFSVRSGATVYMLDYRLAPEHPYPAALDDGLAAYQALLAQGYTAKNIVLGGDSGGCAHILALAIALREQNLPLPAGMVMISPFLDLTLSAASVTSRKHRDPMVTVYALRRGADGYRGGIPATDAPISPLFADLRGLPPTLVQAGSEEILLDDALSFSARAQQAGMTVDCQIYAGMWHNFQMFNRLLKTPDQALDKISDFVRQSVRNI